MNTKNIYISSNTSRSGTLFITMGIIQLLKSKMSKIAFYCPVVIDEKNNDIEFVREYFHLSNSFNSAFTFTLKTFENTLNTSGGDEILARCLKDYKKLEKENDFVICQGLSKELYPSFVVDDFNTIFSSNFSSSHIDIINAHSKTSDQIIEEIRSEQKRKNLLSIFVNRLDETTFDELKSKNYQNVNLLMEDKELDLISLLDVKEYLGCEQVFGSSDDLNKVIKSTRIAAMNLEHFICHIEDSDLVIVPSDRVDIILGSLLALYSKNYPAITAILLSGDVEIPQSIMKLFDGFDKLNIPMLKTKLNTYESALKVSQISSSIRPHSKRKIALALGLFNKSVNKELILEKIDSSSSKVVTPKMFEYKLFELASRKKMNIVLNEADDDRILRATEILLRQEVVDITLLGIKEEILHQASLLGIDISKAKFVDPHSSSLKEAYSKEFYEMRKAKGLSLDAARDALEHYNYFATMMVYKKDADAMVSGATHTTADTIRPALQIIKTSKGIDLVSSVFLMLMSEEVLIYADCAINQNPSSKELAQIAISSATTAKAFDIEPKVAMLSYSSGDSGSGEMVEKVKEATKIAHELDSKLLLDGPLQYDAATIEKIAKKKMPSSKVAGNANVLIFPDLNTGNNTYKAVQRSSGAIAIGPILQGLNAPINDLSRGCEIEDIVNTVLITAIQAQERV